MSRPTVPPTGREIRFADDDIIVTKTDAKGIITYANDVFLAVAGYREQEVLGQPHNIIRHPDMPRSVFAFLWETIAQSREIFAYVNNLARSGDHYWVFAHVTASVDDQGRIIGYHSSRRSPRPAAVAKVAGLYAAMQAAEQAAPGPREAIAAGTAVLTDALAKAGISYQELIFSL